MVELQKIINEALNSKL